MPDDLAYIASRHVRRTTANPPRDYCPADNQDWPCDTRRALDAAGSWREHAELDCAALGRAWACGTAWDDVAGRWPDGLGLTAAGLHPETLRACAAALRDRVQGASDG